MTYKVIVTHKDNIKLVMSRDIAKAVYADLGEAPGSSGVPYDLWKKLEKALEIV